MGLSYENDEILIINTNFDPQKNSKYAFSGLDKNEIFQATEHERDEAGKAYVPDDFDELQQLVIDKF
jgi:hypothetical protein